MLGRSRGGWGSNDSRLVVDGHAIRPRRGRQRGPNARIDEVRRADGEGAAATLDRLAAQDRRGQGCATPRVRGWLERRGIEAVIPQRSDQIEHKGWRTPLDRKAYTERAPRWRTAWAG